MLFTRHERKNIFKSIKFSFKTVIGLCSILGHSLYILSIVIYKFVQWVYHIFFYKMYGFSYWDIQKRINHMTGREFEVFMYHLFKANGFKTKLTEATNDGGKDLIVWINGEKTYIELKRWSGDWKIGREILQKLVGATVGDKADRCICITTGKYNNNAIEYAEKIDNLELWEMKDILKLCHKVENKMPYVISQCMGSENGKVINLFEINKI